jgi:hypothetical protein
VNASPVFLRVSSPLRLPALLGRTAGFLPNVTLGSKVAIAIAAWLAAAPLLLTATEVLSHPLEAPETKNEQQSTKQLQGDVSPKADQGHSTEPVPHSQSVISTLTKDKSGTETENREEQGTEFWPPVFGYRLKVTDTLLAVFTAGLFIACLSG